MWYRIDRENLATGESDTLFCWQSPEDYIELKQEAFEELVAILSGTLSREPAETEDNEPEPMVDLGLSSQGIESDGTLTLAGLSIGVQEEPSRQHGEKSEEDTNTLRVKQLLAARQPNSVVDEDGVEQG